jgi:hypothetical protein
MSCCYARFVRKRAVRVPDMQQFDHVLSGRHLPRFKQPPPPHLLEEARWVIGMRFVPACDFQS